MSHEPKVWATSTARTTSGNLPLALARDPGLNVSVLLSVTAVAGTTPTLDVSLQWSHDGIVWADADIPDSFPQVTASKATVKTFPIRAPLARLVWTIGGTTPSFTFEARAYATR